MTKPTDFDAQEAITEVGSALDDVRKANEGVNFDEKVREAIRRSTDVQKEIRGVGWSLLKEKIVWVIVGAFSFIAFDLLKSLLSKLISKI